MIRRLCPAICLLLLVFFGNAMPARAKTLKVIAGTSLIENIVLDLTGKQADVITVMPGSSCPGHETVKTTDFLFAARADIILVHSFQQKMPWLTGMMEAVESKNLQLVVLDLKGSWLIPEVQKRATQDIAAALSKAFPQDAGAIAGRMQKRLARVDAAEKETKARLTPLQGNPVAVTDMQSEFARWAGLTVVGSYEPQDLHPKGMAQMVERLRGKRLAGVIDNYQSGSDAGLPLALELKAPHVVLSNFPGSSDDAFDYFSLLRHNVDQLLRLSR